MVPFPGARSVNVAKPATEEWGNLFDDFNRTAANVLRDQQVHSQADRLAAVVTATPGVQALGLNDLQLREAAREIAAAWGPSGFDSQPLGDLAKLVLVNMPKQAWQLLAEHAQGIGHAMSVRFDPSIQLPRSLRAGLWDVREIHDVSFSLSTHRGHVSLMLPQHWTKVVVEGELNARLELQTDADDVWHAGRETDANCQSRVKGILRERDERLHHLASEPLAHEQRGADPAVASLLAIFRTMPAFKGRAVTTMLHASATEMLQAWGPSGFDSHALSPSARQVLKSMPTEAWQHLVDHAKGRRWNYATVRLDAAAGMTRSMIVALGGVGEIQSVAFSMSEFRQDPSLGAVPVDLNLPAHWRAVLIEGDLNVCLNLNAHKAVVRYAGQPNWCSKGSEVADHEGLLQSELVPEARETQAEFAGRQLALQRATRDFLGAASFESTKAMASKFLDDATLRNGDILHLFSPQDYHGKYALFPYGD